MTALLLWAFVSNVVNVLRGVDAPVVLFSSFIYSTSLTRSQAAKSSPKQHGLIKCSPTFDRLKRLVLKRMSRR
jgi:hypothetical protein